MRVDRYRAPHPLRLLDGGWLAIRVCEAACDWEFVAMRVGPLNCQRHHLTRPPFGSSEDSVVKAATNTDFL